MDVLIAINFFATFLLLRCAALLSAVHIKRWRALLGALLGGAQSLMIYLPESAAWVLILEKLFCALLLLLAAFGFGSFRRFLRCAAAFLGVNVAFAGIMLALDITLHPTGLSYYNGTIYFDVSLLTFVLFALLCYSIVRGTLFLIRRKHPGTSQAEVTIYVDARSVSLQALYDTGNALTDAMTGTPVMLAEFSALHTYIPPRWHDYFEGNLSGLRGDDTAGETATDGWDLRLRSIPFQAVGNKGLLPAFRADKIIAKAQGKQTVTQGGIVAVTTDVLSDGAFSAILQRDMLTK
jgi:stage II sporulation protein GA (sporulation sigma-E factor processing peptidase)